LKDRKRQILAVRRPRNADTFVKSVRRLITKRLKAKRTLDIRTVAALARIRPRTFQRRLAKSRTTYAGLVGEARLQRAIELLANSRHDVANVAFHLGYADPANFTRAFKRWTGKTPSEFRSRRR
jgi:AraC-like DNA-binding protein